MGADLLEEACTIKEAQANSSKTILNLASTSVSRLQPELRALKSITFLNLADNEMTELPGPGELPPRLSELTVSGNNITSLSSLSSFKHLKKLHAGANRLSSLDAVFTCASLKHVGLAFNAVQSVPTSLPSACQLLSLDLSNNDITCLGSTLSSLAQLPMLRALSLAGNPVALLPSYETAVRGRLKALAFFDGTRIDPLAGTPSMSALHVPPPQTDGSSGADRVDTFLQLELSGLTPLEDPFEGARGGGDTWSAAEARGQTPPAGTSPPGPAPQSPLPLQPVYYHVELSDPCGVSYASVPLRVLPPQQQSSQLAEPDPKAKKDAGKKAGGKKGVDDEAPGASGPALKTRGSLTLCLGLSATPLWRDWLRAGVRLTLVRTTLTAVAKPPSPDDTPPPPPPDPKAKAKGGKGAVEEPAAGPPPCDVVPSIEAVAISTLQCAALVGGHARAFDASASFVPIPRLWDERGVRMSLQDDRHSTRPIARMAARLRLHVAPGLIAA